jgi:Uma2 family endonuclease
MVKGPDEGQLMATAEPRTADPQQCTSPSKGPARGFPPHRLTADRYERTVELGIFGEDEPISLWRGGLVEKVTKGPSHTYTLNKLAERLDRLVPEGWFTEQEGAMAVSDDSMPEPDLKVVRGSHEDFKDHAPSSRDVAPVIEVADSSLAVDSGEVLETYPREALPVYWLVNLPGRRFEVFAKPQDGRYGEHRVYGPDEAVPVTLDGREAGRIAVSEVLV